HITYEFQDYYVIAPTIQFSFITDFSKNALGESGKLVPRGFSYDSGTNKQWLSREEFLELLQ
ncbi:MAG: UDP-N-acetylglucosamine 4,6-dehydratase (inverting), partial [Helicobacter sp.]|nr:UDP-N-acetylglucosamine 4,6-dehydratase (inverting) [Helicobacter sp.]